MDAGVPEDRESSQTMVGITRCHTCLLSFFTIFLTLLFNLLSRAPCRFSLLATKLHFAQS